ncbi:hypothetical protein Tco_0736099, partial [Tanacetum coccineum]
KKYKGISSSTRKGSADFSVDAILDKPAMIEGASSSKEDTQVGENGQVDILSHKVRLLEAYSWGQKVVGGIEAAWGVKKTENETEKGKKTENETEKGWEHFLGIKRWSVGMRLRQVQRRGKMKPRRVRD